MKLGKKVERLLEENGIDDFSVEYEDRYFRLVLRGSFSDYFILLLSELVNSLRVDYPNMGIKLSEMPEGPSFAVYLDEPGKYKQPTPKTLKAN